ncbi:hypothetical protein MTO96_040837 [Rhipicephalus appendiculatus]
MQPQAVLSLGDTGPWWLPDFEGVTSSETIESIQSALISLNPLKTRAFCLARFYCCLAERHVLSPWKRFHVEAMATAPTGPLTLHDRLASALLYPGGHSVGAKIETSGMKYACVMATNPGRHTAVHDMIIFRFHPSLPLFHVYPSLPNSRFITALHQLLRGDSARMPEGYLGELRFAFAGVPEPFGSVAAPPNSNPWDHPGITSVIPFQTGRREERGQPAQPTRTPPSSVASGPSGGNILNALEAYTDGVIHQLGNPMAHADTDGSCNRGEFEPRPFDTLNKDYCYCFFRQS